jgi:methylated-DNA-[protein]-cysteine S-methyltransferase
MELRYALVKTKAGWLGISGSAAGLRRLILPQASPQAVLSMLDNCLIGATPDISLFGALSQRLKRYFEGETVTFPDKLDLAEATSFQSAVWQVTRSIPYGETRSYTWVAQQIGMPQASRVVGQALAKNPLPIVVPCHRVIGKQGNLCGFRDGLEMKYHLLQMEAGGYTFDTLSPQRKPVRKLG